MMPSQGGGCSEVWTSRILGSKGGNCLEHEKGGKLEYQDEGQAEQGQLTILCQEMSGQRHGS